jgi:indole-3-glycerol phosphate synthase
MNILEEIYQHKLVEVRNCKKNKSLHDICSELKLQNRKPQDFSAALQNKIINNDPAIICEVKKASPSKGIIRDDFDPVKIAKIYEENGAACISVLTDEKYFMGHSKYLSDIRKNVKIPILRKDFIIDVYQIYEAKLLGADCILLIMAMLDLQKAQELEKIAHDIGLSVLIEIHDEAELEKALKLRSALIGINNRNLKTFEIDINNSIKLSKLIPKDKIIICESGIYSRDDIKKMQLENINSFLIGESLMRQDDIAQALQSLLEKESCFF